MRAMMLWAGGISLTLSGCYSLQGPPQLINGSGVVNQKTNVAARSESLTDNFRLAVDDAVKDGATPQQVERMIDTGVLLVRTNCDDFFRRMGAIQRDSRISRDMIAPVVAVLSGLVALQGFSGGKTDNYLQALSVGSTAAIAGIDIVDRHFLFGADNIHSVEQLTFRALNAHQRGIAQNGPYSFEGAVLQLIDHQVICTPASILDLTKRAITAGDVEPRPSSGGGAGGDDAEALAALGRELGQPGPATPDQAGALYWLFRGAPAATDLPTIAGKLGAGSAQLIAPTGPGATMTLSGQANSRKQVIWNALDALSPETRRAFEAAIASPPAGGVPAFALAPRSTVPGRVELDVR